MAKPQERIVFHVDLDCFYAAVETRDDPKLAGKPVVVGADPKGGTGRGVVATCNYEARKFGIRSAMPISKAYKLCPSAAFLPVDFEKYVPASRQVMEILQRYSAVFEPAGIDEAYLDVSKKCKDFKEAQMLARELQQAVLKETGLSCSVGVGPNKLIAKIASSFRKPFGITVVPPQLVLPFLDPLPVGELWGVGKKTAAWLNSHLINSIKDLRMADPVALVEALGEFGGRLHRMTYGEDDRPVGVETELKSIGREHTFQSDAADPAIVLREVDRLSEDVGREVREEGWQFRTVVVKVRFAGFETHTAQGRVAPSDSGAVLRDAARNLVLSLCREGRPVRLVGVKVTDLESTEGQTHLAQFTAER